MALARRESRSGLVVTCVPVLSSRGDSGSSDSRNSLEVVAVVRHREIKCLTFASPIVSDNHYKTPSGGGLCPVTAKLHF